MAIIGIITAFAVIIPRFFSNAREISALRQIPLVSTGKESYALYGGFPHATTAKPPLRISHAAAVFLMIGIVL